MDDNESCLESKLSWLNKLLQYRRTVPRLKFHSGKFHWNSDPHDEDAISIGTVV
ncbi:unnamed protein product [Larinioides sclopetarius]|uniref:Uncharacterized protein n=1 Tax=Larinioides sclopetarius TaxID=280406 RepID=A0AAV1ZND0_9ARAC